MDREQKLKEARKKILEQILNKPEFITELKSIKDVLTEIKDTKNNGLPLEMGEVLKFINDILFKLEKKELKYTPDTNLVEKIALLAEKIEEIQLPKPELKVNVPDKVFVKNLSEIKMPILKEIKVSNLNEIIQREFPKEIKVSNLNQIKQIMPNDQMPKDVSMELTYNDLWKSIDINYPDKTINIKIDRTDKDVIKGLVFSQN